MNMNVQVVGQHFYSKLLFVLLAAIVAQYVYIIMSYPLFSFSDEAEFFPYLLGEGHYPWRYFPEYGRCYFLSLMEYFPVAALDIFSVKEKMFLMYCINSVKIGLIVYLTKCCFHKISGEFVAFVGTCAFMFLFIKFGLFTTILTLAYPEFSLTLLLIIFLLLYLQGLETDKIVDWAFVVGIAFLSLFFKETVFVIFLVFCTSRIFLSYKKLSHREFTVDIALIGLSLCYILLFYFFIYSKKTSVFYDGLDRHFIHNLLVISKTNIVFIPSVILLAARFILVCFKKKKPYIFDVFIAVSVFYVVPFAFMGLAAAYYFSPSLFFFAAGLVGYSAKFSPEFRSQFCVKSIFAIFFAGILLVSNHFYVEYKSEQQTYKKITIPLLGTINELSKEDYKVYFFVDDALKGNGHIFMHGVSMWFYHTLNSYENFYFKRDYTIDLLTKFSDLSNGHDKKIIFYYDQDGALDLTKGADFISLDFVFVQALVNKKFVQDFFSVYKNFYDTVCKSRIRPLNLKKVEDSFRELERVRNS